MLVTYLIKAIFLQMITQFRVGIIEYENHYKMHCRQFGNILYILDFKTKRCV